MLLRRHIFGSAIGTAVGAAVTSSMQWSIEATSLPVGVLLIVVTTIVSGVVQRWWLLRLQARDGALFNSRIPEWWLYFSSTLLGLLSGIVYGILLKAISPSSDLNTEFLIGIAAILVSGFGLAFVFLRIQRKIGAS